MTNIRSIIDYGAWVRARLVEHKITPAELSRETGIMYPSLDRMLKAGEKGEPGRPTAPTIEKINKALVKLGALEDENEGWVAAGFMVPGYKVVKESDLQETTSEPPENWEDWPQELQDALSYTRPMSKEVQRFIFQLWKEQARAHYDIEMRRREAEKKLLERQRLLDEMK